MPWLVAYGLLPGRGVPCGRGIADGDGADPDGFGSAAAVGCSSCLAGAAAAAVWLGDAAGFGVCGRAPGFAAGRPAGLASVDPAAGKASRSRFATGGSIVDDGLFTYSPNSWSFAINCLLGIPSSLAISLTRGFVATILLSRAHPSRASH